MVDVGSGPAIVIVPGIQGRWEWMRPAVAALSTEWRVITSSLPAADNFDQLVGHVDRMLDEASLSGAVVCGVSFGGLVALRYAATRRARVRALILVSTPGPSWQPEPRQATHIRWPILSSPFFLAAAGRRAWTELRVTLPDLRDRLAFCAASAKVVLGAPGIPWRMGARARMAASEGFEADCSRITAPTLVIAGERELDKVVKFDDAMEYTRRIPGAEFRLFDRTGHLGTMSAPDRFAAIVSTFLRQVPD
jgi:3-oxoadipate enol-lactonase